VRAFIAATGALALGACEPEGEREPPPERCTTDAQCDVGVCSLGYCTTDDDARDDASALTGCGEAGPFAVTVRLRDGVTPVCEGAVLVDDESAPFPVFFAFDDESCTFTAPADAALRGAITIEAHAFAFETHARAIDLCGPAELTINLARKPGACMSDGACEDGMACAIHRTTLNATCEEPVGAAAGEACATDDECANGYCVHDACATRCDTDTDCATDQNCRAQHTLIGARVCVPQDC
jgi:hypothetical protein